MQHGTVSRLLESQSNCDVDGGRVQIGQRQTVRPAAQARRAGVPLLRRTAVARLDVLRKLNDRFCSSVQNALYRVAKKVKPLDRIKFLPHPNFPPHISSLFYRYFAIFFIVVNQRGKS